VSTRDGFELNVINADGSGQRNLTRELGTDNGPAWSPDGDGSPFGSLRDRNPEIYLIKADGSGEWRRRRNGADEVDMVWSAARRRPVVCPEGEWLPGAPGSNRRMTLLSTGRVPGRFRRRDVRGMSEDRQANPASEHLDLQVFLHNDSYQGFWAGSARDRRETGGRPRPNTQQKTLICR
jgi:hypothetical protein